MITKEHLENIVNSIEEITVFDDEDGKNPVNIPVREMATELLAIRSQKKRLIEAGNGMAEELGVLSVKYPTYIAYKKIGEYRTLLKELEK